jgi:hypothetical protein
VQNRSLRKKPRGGSRRWERQGARASRPCDVRSSETNQITSPAGTSGDRASANACAPGKKAKECSLSAVGNRPPRSKAVGVQILRIEMFFSVDALHRDLRMHLDDLSYMCWPRQSSKTNKLPKLNPHEN